jgi:hypothetical protein
MYLNGNKRTAICFSGQPRTWKKCIDTWKKFFLTDTVDIFCHIWDYNTVPNALLVGKNVYNEPVSSTEINELFSELKPKKFIVESAREFSVDSSHTIQVQSFLSQYYGIAKSAELKKQYEIEHDFIYDKVFRLRYDAAFQHEMRDRFDSMVEPNTMEGFHFGWNFNNNRGRIGDIYWEADSRTYDIIADYYLNLPYINSKFFDTNYEPEQIFYHYIKKNNILIKSNHWDIKVARLSKELSCTGDNNGYETW